MPLFILEPVSQSWGTPSMLVRADTEEAARHLAARYGMRHDEPLESKWFDPALVSCSIAPTDGDAAVVREFG